MNKFIVLAAVAALMCFSDFSMAKGSSFGGSRSSGSSSYSSGRSSGSSSFGGSRSSGSSSSFGGSRSGSGSSYSKPSTDSSFGGSRSTPSAPIVRKQTPSSPAAGTTTNNVSNNYYGGGYGYHPYYGYGGYGGGFYHGFFWGQYFNRPQVIYVNGNSYVQGANGQPLLDEQGQPVVYQSNTGSAILGILVWLCLLSLLGYVVYRFVLRGY